MSVRYSLGSRAEGVFADIRFDDDKVNAMSTDWYDALTAAFDQALVDGAQLVVLRGRPGVFSAGMNIKLLPSLSPAERRKMTDRFAETMHKVWTFPLPTLALVTGHAVAGGCILASACDRRIGLDGAYRIQMNEHLIGMAIPEWIRPLCANAFPMPQLESLLMLGEAFSPAQCLSMGFFHSLVQEQSQFDAALDTALASFWGLDLVAFATTRKRSRQAISQALLERLDQL